MTEPKTRRGKVTIRDVAADAGVSTAAVSKVLRNAYGVSDTLRGKVLKSIEKLGYRPSTAARGMRGRTYSVGMLLVEMHNPFVPYIVGGAKEALHKAGYKALIGVGEAEEAIEGSLIDSMIDLQMDGLLLVTPRLPSEVLSRYAAQSPTVVIGHHEDRMDAFDTVNSDDRLGARMAVEALLARGCRDVQMISQPTAGSSREVFDVRERGYLEVMAEAGLSDRTRIWRVGERRYRPGQSVNAFLDQAQLPDGLFCWSDIHAIEIMNAAFERGIPIPERLLVVGYDNSPVAAMPMIGLSSIEQRGTTLGELAAKALLSRIGGRTAPEHLLVRPELVVRRSLG
ncbi:LacI family DNA-binding transcriptional regulator [Marinovum sp.]|uniref:LacI family DNA-binding transcriptional regulator n=1 Tax=Marinovum sp. TaxID=2024839 RepID=UPI002B276E16|nr:LacI family DNA-binding transcriptional regulator [Marinovum sp.]